MTLRASDSLHSFPGKVEKDHMEVVTWRRFFEVLAFVVVFAVPVILYLMEKAGSSLTWIFFVGWLSMAAAALYLALSIPWVWADTPTAVRVWRVSLVSAIALLVVGYGAIKIWPKTGTFTEEAKAKPADHPQPENKPEPPKSTSEPKPHAGSPKTQNAKDSLVINALAGMGSYVEGSQIGSINPIRWETYYSEVQIIFVNTSSEDFDAFDFSIDPDQVIFAASQITEIPGVSIFSARGGPGSQLPRNKLHRSLRIALFCCQTTSIHLLEECAARNFPDNYQCT